MVLLAMLAGVNWLELPGATAHAPISATVICLAPVFSGLFVAPWLTLLCRSPLAGTVFTVALPFGFWTLSEAMALARFGFDYTASSETVNFKAGVMGFMLLAHWAGGAVCGWRKFRRLEAIEGRVGELHLPRWLSRQHPAKSVTRPSKSGHPLWGLVKKELRLQQIAFFTAGIFLLVWLCWWQIHRLRPDLGSTFIDAGTFLYVGLLPLLIGAVASAEERQLGTAEWQILLPVAARKQWMIKVAVLLALSIILAVLLPVGALGLFSWGGDFKEGLLSLTMVFCGAAVALTTMSLYISSACNNGLKAMLVSLPVAVALLALIGIAFKSYLALSELGTGEDSLGKWLAVSAPPILLLGLFLLTSHLPW